MSKKASKYLDIQFMGVYSKGTTLVWSVRNSRSGEKVGEIRWSGAWRGYVFIEDTGPNQYDAAFLRGIADFLDTANNTHREKKRYNKGRGSSKESRDERRATGAST